MKRMEILYEKRWFGAFLAALLAALLLPGVSARLVLDSIQFDPPIIASGDEVDIIVQFHQEGIPNIGDRVGDPSYRFRVAIEPDDTITEQYVAITDAAGDDIAGAIFADGFYNKRFRAKVAQDAPAGSYEFRLIGQWIKDGVAEEGTQFLRFMMPVKREGIILDVASISTEPAEVRPGDDFVRISTRIENVGEKDAKSVEVRLTLPEGIGHSYTDANRQWIGRLNSGESKALDFFVNIGEESKSGPYQIRYEMSYMDLDNNRYKGARAIPFLVKPRPYLEVISSTGSGLAGETGKLTLTVRNTGEESAEAVDVRILKANSQPFVLDVRSDYIGELEPNESGIAVFDIKATRDANIKDYNLKVLIRSKGDSDEGDDTIYLYNRRAKYSVTGTAPNNLVMFGIAGAAAVAIGLIGNAWRKKKRRNRR